jgi:hypothetical protein
MFDDRPLASRERDVCGRYFCAHSGRCQPKAELDPRIVTTRVSVAHPDARELARHGAIGAGGSGRRARVCMSRQQAPFDSRPPCGPQDGDGCTPLAGPVNESTAVSGPNSPHIDRIVPDAAPRPNPASSTTKARHSRASRRTRRRHHRGLTHDLSHRNGANDATPSESYPNQCCDASVATCAGVMTSHRLVVAGG